MEQNLANLYRPRCFADVVGQPLAVETLRRIAMADGIVARAVFLRGAWGSGKCVGGDSRISTDRGYLRIGDIEHSACGFTPMVFGVEQSDGSFADTSHFYHEQACVLRRFVTKSGRSFSGTYDHPVLAYRVGSDRVELVRCGDLRAGDYVARRWLGHIPISMEDIDIEEAKLYCLYGIWLGDGWVSRDGASVGYISQGSLVEWCRSVEGGSQAITPDHRGCSVYRLPFTHSRLSRLIGGACRSWDKCIHEDVFGSRARAFFTLYGLLITDGWIERRGALCFGSTSPHLTKSVCDILDWFSLQYSVRWRRNRKYFYKPAGEYRQCRDSSRITLSVASSELLLEAFVRYASLLGIDDTRANRLLSSYSLYSEASAVRSHKINRKTCFSFSEDVALHVSDLFRSLRSGVDKSLRHKGDQFSRDVGNLRMFRTSSNEAFERSVHWLESCGVEVPASLRSFCGVRFDCIESINDVVEDVYDVSVPSTHLFMSGGLLNHNTTLSRITGKALNCSSFRRSGDICNACDGCHEGDSPTSSLYWELDGTVIGNTEGIRSLRDRLSVVPAGRRLVVLDEVQAISRAAGDALLKIVEEGVPNTMFMFSGTEDILPTLKSRCVNIDITTIPLHYIEDHISRIAGERSLTITPAEVSILAAKSAGHMRDALQLLQFYELVGSRALDSSYFKFRDFVMSCFSKRGLNPEDYLTPVLLYPVIDIKHSVGLFLRTVFTTTDESSVEFKFRKGRLGDTLFKFFFSPVAQQAMQSEVGMEVLLRSLIEKTAGQRVQQG